MGVGYLCVSNLWTTMSLLTTICLVLLLQGEGFARAILCLCTYLFFVHEGLFALIQLVDMRSDLHVVQICTNALVVSHLLFTNECLFF